MKLELTEKESSLFGDNLNLIPTQKYTATHEEHSDRSPFDFMGEKRTAPFLGDDVEKDNYGALEDGTLTCWPFTHEFGWSRESNKPDGKLLVFGRNDNCGSLYIITPVTS